MATGTHGFKPHSMLTSGPPSPPTPPSPQLATPLTPLTTPPDQTQAIIYQSRERPPEYNDWTNSKKANWRRKFERNH